MESEKKFAINTSKGMYFFSPTEILRLEASSNYTYLYFTDHSKLLVSKVLKDFVPILTPFGFLRTHRTHLVNRQYIVCVTANGNIKMKDNSVAEISRRMKREVMQTLKGA